MLVLTMPKRTPQMLKKSSFLVNRSLLVEANNMQLDKEDTQRINLNVKYLCLTLLLNITILLFVFNVFNTFKVRYDITIRSPTKRSWRVWSFSDFSAQLTSDEEEISQGKQHCCRCVKHTATYGWKTAPCSIRLARSYGGSIENESRITFKKHIIGEHRGGTRRGAVLGNR